MKNILIKTVSTVVVFVLLATVFVGCGGKDGTVFESDGFKYKVYSDHVELIEYVGNGGKVTVPDSLKGEPVTVLAEGLFKNRSNITEITIPSSVTDIQAEAFSHCTALTVVNVPEGVKTMGTGVLSIC